MSETTTPTKPYTIPEYLELELAAEGRHEYHSGTMYAMAGGTRNHGILGAGIVTELTVLTRGSSCTTFNGDVKIRVDSENRFLYPEASVVCGEVESSDLDKDSIINPILLVEVLSPSTEAYGRGKKFMLYQQLPSFREYLLIDQERPVVTSFYRNDQGIWETYSYMGLGDKLIVRTLDGEIPMQILYDKVEGLRPIFDPV